MSVIDNNWTKLHTASWKGHSFCVSVLIQKKMKALSEDQSPLYLALARWGNSPAHQKMIEALWDYDPAPHLARWGDSAWGGSLTLLDLAVDRDIPDAIFRCKERHIHPEDRTWAMALLHDSNGPLVTLGKAFLPPDYLPQDSARVQRMHSARQAFLLDRSTHESTDASGARRL